MPEIVVTIPLLEYIIFEVTLSVALILVELRFVIVPVVVVNVVIPAVP